MLSNGDYQADYVGIEDETAQTKTLGNLLRSLPHLERENYRSYYEEKTSIFKQIFYIIINSIFIFC